jgi:hypothetical protein
LSHIPDFLAARETLGESFDTLLELKATIHSHQQKLDLLTHFKFRFMINLPKMMKEDMDKVCLDSM